MMESAVVCNLANGDIFVKEQGSDTLQGKLFGDAFASAMRIDEPQIGIFEKAYADAKTVVALEAQGWKYRSPGAVALSLAYARQVAFVLYTGNVRIYDFAAGLALCEGLEVVVEQDYVIVSQDMKTVRALDDLMRSMRGEK